MIPHRYDTLWRVADKPVNNTCLIYEYNSKTEMIGAKVFTRSHGIILRSAAIKVSEDKNPLEIISELNLKLMCAA